MSNTLPSFVIIGAAKSGTTSLFNWLGSVPGCRVPKHKEPNFFSAANFKADLGAYSRFFADIEAGVATGEASVSYTQLDLASTTAIRMAALLPDVKLIYLMRHPLQRLRSHYRHQLQRGRERRPPNIAFADPSTLYVESSLYYSCIKPYLALFKPQQLLFVRSEDLFAAEDSTAWSSVLSHLELPPVSRPSDRFNESRSKRQFSRPLLRVWEAGLDQSSAARLVPKAVRRLAYKALSRSHGEYERWMKASDVSLIDSVVERQIWSDISLLEGRLGISFDWDR